MPSPWPTSTCSGTTSPSRRGGTQAPERVHGQPLVAGAVVAGGAERVGADERPPLGPPESAFAPAEADRLERADAAARNRVVRDAETARDRAAVPRVPVEQLEHPARLAQRPHPLVEALGIDRVDEPDAALVVTERVRAAAHELGRIGHPAEPELELVDDVERHRGERSGGASPSLVRTSSCSRSPCRPCGRRPSSARSCRPARSCRRSPTLAAAARRAGRVGDLRRALLRHALVLQGLVLLLVLDVRALVGHLVLLFRLAKRKRWRAAPVTSASVGSAPWSSGELGRSGVEVTRIILGCGNFGGIGSAPEFFGQGESEDEALAIMDAAWELGIRTFDTADAYGGGRSERAIGRWLARARRAPGDRDEGLPLGRRRPGRPRARAGARSAARSQASLERLGLERVDLYLIHEPDPETPVERTLEALDGAGRERYGHRGGREQRRRPVPRGGARDLGAPRPGALRVGAELVLAARPRGRARGAAALPRARPRLHALQPARGRLADRQVPARRAASRRARG